MQITKAISRLAIIAASVSVAVPAVAQVASFDSSNDQAELSIQPNELSSAAQVPPSFSDNVVQALRNQAGAAGQDVDALSFFVAPRQIDGASWTQYQLGKNEIGPNSMIAVQSAADGQFQIFTQKNFPAGGLTAAFNGDTVYFYTGIHPTDQDFEYSVAANGLSVEGATWGTAPGQGMELPGLGPLGGQSVNESPCGTTDDRVSSDHPFVGRIMPLGCTGWLASNGKVMTAGHCVVDNQFIDIEFNVPSSNPMGLVRRATLDNQYRIDQNSIVYSNPYEIGNDWAVFSILANAQTGKTAFEVQGNGFEISNAKPPKSVTIVGYGVDYTPQTANQTQQIHSGALVGEYIRGNDDVVLKHKVDTRSGNSGSAIVGLNASGVETAYGIHTNAGCVAFGGSNSATGFKNNSLWTAAQ